MEITIVKSLDRVNGKLLEINVDKKTFKVIFTWYALDP